MTVEQFISAIRSLEDQSGPVYIKVGNMMYPVIAVRGSTVGMQHFVVIDSGVVEAWERSSK